MGKINMKIKTKDITLDEGFNKFIYEHCVLKNFRESTIKHYRELMQYSFYLFIDKDINIADITQNDINSYL